MNTSIRSTAAFAAVAAALGLPGTAIASVPPDAAPAASGGPVDLSGICPDTIVVQTDWFPESEYGATYQLIGPDYTIDATNKIVSGPLYHHGEPTGVDIEVRAGGPAIGADVETEFYLDDDITFAYGTTDGQALAFSAAPILSVVAPLEENPQIIMWDPETYPEIETLADLGAEEVIINVFGGQTFSAVFVGEGVWSEDQVDPSYDGSPRSFIASEGTIAQQGFASSEPYSYEHVYEEWGQPVAYQTIHDAGFQVYSQTFGIRPDDLETLRPCLELFVPIVQQAAIDFVTDPTATNALIVETVEAYDTFWEYTPELAAYSVETQRELGLTGNGGDDTVGNFDVDRVDTVLTQMRDAGIDIPDDLTADQLVTNEFIDPTIGF